MRNTQGPMANARRRHFRRIAPALSVLVWRRTPNRWDALALGLLFCAFIMIAQTARETAVPLATLQQHPITLDAQALPD